MDNNYFEAILQLRNPAEEVELYILKSLNNQISKVEEVRNGVDYYIRDKKKAQRVGKEIQEKFGGEFKHTSTLHTRNHQTSKEVYRDTVLIKLPGFMKGDVIKVEDKLLKVSGMGKKVSGSNLKTGKKEVIKYPENFEKLEKQTTRVIKKKPIIEVLHPETYQPTVLHNKPDKELQVDEKVKVVVDKAVYAV